MTSLLRSGFLLVAMAGALCGCAGNSDINPNAPYVSAHTGTVTTIEGIDVYQDQLPTRTYRVVSTIDDRRQDDLTPQHTILASLAARARKAGGNGVIIISMKTQDVGGQNYTPNSAPFTAPGAMPSVNNTLTVTRAQVIAYTDKAPVTTPVTAPAPATPAAH